MSADILYKNCKSIDCSTKNKNAYIILHIVWHGVKWISSANGYFLNICIFISYIHRYSLCMQLVYFIYPYVIVLQIFNDVMSISFKDLCYCRNLDQVRYTTGIVMSRGWIMHNSKISPLNVIFLGHLKLWFLYLSIGFLYWFLPLCSACCFHLCWLPCASPYKFPFQSTH
jgi:hypothetical protein